MSKQRLNTVYVLINKAIEIGRYKTTEEYTKANEGVKAALDALLPEDIAFNRQCKHPILHETAQQICGHDHIINKCFPTFRLVWEHPSLINLWHSTGYKDEYRNTAAQRLQWQMPPKTMRPEYGWIHENIFGVPFIPQQPDEEVKYVLPPHLEGKEFFGPDANMTSEEFDEMMAIMEVQEKAHRERPKTTVDIIPKGCIHILKKGHQCGQELNQNSHYCWSHNRYRR